jgi:hypothetical protein
MHSNEKNTKTAGHAAYGLEIEKIFPIFPPLEDWHTQCR